MADETHLNHGGHGDIDRYVDGELPAEEMRAMDNHLRDCAPCAMAVLERVQLKRATRLAGRQYVPSAEFRRRVEQRIAKRSATFTLFRRFWAPALAFAAVLLVIAGIALDRRSDSVRQQQLLGELADLHVSDLASSNPVDVVSSDRHTVKPWFQGKLPFSFDLPDPQNADFKLVGGRVVYLEHEPGAHLIYDHLSHHISVFIFRDRPDLDSAFSAAQRSHEVLSFHSESWATQTGLRYFVFGDASPDSIHQLAEFLRKAS